MTTIQIFNPTTGTQINFEYPDLTKDQLYKAVRDVIHGSEHSFETHNPERTIIIPKEVLLNSIIQIF